MQNPSSRTNTRQWSKDVPKILERSPLYLHLHTCIEQDQELISLQELIATDEPFPVLFFAVINYLLFSEQGRQHPFAAFHPYLTPTPRPIQESYPAFRDFVHVYGEELRSLLPNARLQTNEVTRCANLLPVFELVSRRGGHQPLALIEIGASAGFNLYWDHYTYLYHRGDHTAYTIGEASSPVQIHCALQGEHMPPFPTTMPIVASRIGLDLMPLDCLNPQDIRKLQACIWPEETWRYQLLDATLTVVQQNPPRLLAGDASDLLPDLLTAIPAEHTICLYHSFALLHNPPAIRDRIFDLLAAYSRTHTLYRISLEWDHFNRWPTPHLELFTYQGGKQTQQEWLANCSVHGETLEWLSAVG